MLQIKNTLGGGKPEGLYVWKKYSFDTVSWADGTDEQIVAMVEAADNGEINLGIQLHSGILYSNEMNKLQ